MHPFKPQLKILDRALSSQLCRCRALKRLERKAFTALQRSNSGKKKRKDSVYVFSPADRQVSVVRPCTCEIRDMLCIKAVVQGLLYL